MQHRGAWFSRVRTLAAVAAPVLVVAACGGGGSIGQSGGSGGGGAGSGSGSISGGNGTQGVGAGGPGSGASGPGVGAGTSSGNPTSTGTGNTCGGQICPSGFTCGSANGIPVCKSATGIPMFKHVFVIMMENLSNDTLLSDLPDPSNIQTILDQYASGSDYHGVTHPSSPNYIALTSGDFWGIQCDGSPIPNQDDCTGYAIPSVECQFVTPSCNQNVDNIGDQLEAAGLNWLGLGEGMGGTCKLDDDSNSHFAVRHMPFVYYDSIRNDAARCNQHVVDLANLDLSSSAPELQFIAPNLTDDMHDPFVPGFHSTNVANGDAWLGPTVTDLLFSDAYADGGLVVIVWDEDNDSGTFAADDPIPIMVLSPYAKGGGYVSPVTANHYSLLATIEDAFGLPRLANAGSADPLYDYFPDN